MTDAHPIRDPAGTPAGRVSVTSIRADHDARAGRLAYAGAGEVSASAALAGLIGVIERAAQVGPLPTVGSPEWSALPPGDPRRIGAIYVAAVAHAVELELRHDEHAAAAEQLAASGMASAANRRHRDREQFYAQHPDLRRIA